MSIRFIVFGILSSLVFQESMAEEKYDSTFIKQHIKLRNLVIQDPSGALNSAYELKTSGESQSPISDLGLSHLIMGNSMWAIGEYPEAIKNYFEALEIFEKTDNTYGQITAFNDISLIYIEEKNFEDGLRSLEKSRELNREFGSKWLDAVIYSNIGDLYLRTDQLDSAFAYTSQSYTYAKQVQDSSLYAFILKNFGNISLRKGDLQDARKHFLSALSVAEALRDGVHEIEIFTDIGNYFMEVDKLDSAYKYFHLANEKAEDINSVKKIWTASDKLRHIFERSQRFDSAYYYGQKAQVLKDTILGADRIRLTDHYQKMEDIREEQVKAEEERRQEARKHFMEYLIIGIIILSFAGGAFMLRKVNIPVFWFEAYLVVVLLLIFEFITLLVHSYAEEVTHHSPILTLFILVVIASFLGPLHHKSVKHAKRILIVGEKDTNSIEY